VTEALAQSFERQRPHLRAVAYRLLGSLQEAEDAVQEAWLRLGRAPAAEIANLGGWLTTVVSRLCLDALRRRQTRREESLEEGTPVAAPPSTGGDPEEEAIQAESVGLALLVVLDRLSPAERVAFVLHDLFDQPFEEIAEIVDRTPAAARQLASRARRRVHGPEEPEPATVEQRALAQNLMRALRAGDIPALLSMLDPELVVHAGPRVVHGAETWVHQAIAFTRGLGGLRGGALALVDGTPGAILAPRGRLQRALRLSYAAGRVTAIDIVTDPERLRTVEIAVL